MPPPNTKSNSSSPVRQRFASEPVTSRSRGVTATLPPSASDRVPPMRRAVDPNVVAARAVTTSSASVFHSPHVSQRPCHFEYSAPHSAQRNAVLTLAMQLRSTTAARQWTASATRVNRCGRALRVVLEPREMLLEEQIHDARRTIALLADNDFRLAFQ